MASNNYQIVFDLAHSPDRWMGSVGWMYLLPAVGALLLLIPQRHLDRVLVSGPKGQTGRIFLWIWFGLTILITGWATIAHLRQDSILKSVEQEGGLSIVEGCLQSFHAMPASGHDEDRIRVEGRSFSYSDFDESTPAFNRTQALGGPIHSNSAVRIWFSGNSIVKLGVRQDSCPPAPDL